MAYEVYTGNYDDDQALVAYLIQLHQYARLQRVNFETQWEEEAALYWPEYRNSFTYGHVRAPGVKYTQYQVDITGSICAQRFTSIADTLVTPFHSQWSLVRPADEYLRKQSAARKYFDDVSRVLWTERYRAEANFQAQNQTNLHCLGVFGNMGMIIDELDTRPARGRSGLRYMMTSPGEIYLLQNHQGLVDGFIRHFRWTARQAYQRWGEKIPPALHAALQKADTFTLFDFLQFVIPRTDFDPMMVFSTQGKPWSSTYVSVVGYSILERGGYRSFPLSYGRYMQAPEEWYGRGPGGIGLPEAKTKNAEKTAFLQQGALAGDPAYLLPDDGMFDFKSTSGSYNYGGMSEDGRPLVGVVPTGNIQITQELMADSDTNLKAIFLNDLFPLLFSDKSQQRSAREVVEMAIQQGIFLSPLARQYTEYCSPMIHREIDLLSYLKKLPPMPPVVAEYAGNRGIDYEIQYTSPLAQALDMPAIGGFMRTVEMATQIANSTGDRSIFYYFGFKRAMPAIATAQRVPEDWMSTPKEVADQQKAAAAAAERERQTKELPGKAAIMKAQAISDKAAAGQNIGGTLSGVPAGQMPQMPGMTQ